MYKLLYPDVQEESICGNFERFSSVEIGGDSRSIRSSYILASHDGFLQVDELKLTHRNQEQVARSSSCDRMSALVVNTDDLFSLMLCGTKVTRSSVILVGR